MNCILENQLPTAITQKLLRRETLKDPVMQALVEVIGAGECRTSLHGYQNVFHELTVIDQIVIRQLQGRDPQLVIPKGLQTEAIHLAQ